MGQSGGRRSVGFLPTVGSEPESVARSPQRAAAALHLPVPEDRLTVCQASDFRFLRYWSASFGNYPRVVMSQGIPDTRTLRLLRR